MKKLISMYTTVSGYLKNEKGAQSLEWLGLAALLIMVIGFITTALGDGGSIKSIVENIITKIGEQVG